MSGLINASESSQLEFEESLLLLSRMFKLRLLRPSSLGEWGSWGVLIGGGGCGIALDIAMFGWEFMMAAWF